MTEIPPNSTTHPKPQLSEKAQAALEKARRLQEITSSMTPKSRLPEPLPTPSPESSKSPAPSVSAPVSTPPPTPSPAPASSPPETDAVLPDPANVKGEEKPDSRFHPGSSPKHSDATKPTAADKPTLTEVQGFLLNEWTARKVWARTIREVRNLLNNDRSINLLIQRSVNIFGGHYPPPYDINTVAEMEEFVGKIRTTFAKEAAFYHYLPSIIKLNGGGVGYNYDWIAVILVHLLYIEELNRPNAFYLKRIGYPHQKG
jgi:hypothetical protein